MLKIPSGKKQWKHRADKNRTSSSDSERVATTKKAAEKVLGILDFHFDETIEVPGFRGAKKPDLVSFSTGIIIEDNGGVHDFVTKTRNKDQEKYDLYNKGGYFTIVLPREKLKQCDISEKTFMNLIFDTVQANVRGVGLALP